MGEGAAAEEWAEGREEGREGRAEGGAGERRGRAAGWSLQPEEEAEEREEAEGRIRFRRPAVSSVQKSQTDREGEGRRWT